MKPYLLCCVFLALWRCSLAMEPNKVLAIILGGFRWDYLHRDCFKKVRSYSAYPKWLQPIFPSASTSNSEALSTGLYTESHGILGQEFYSYDNDEIFTLETIASWTDPMWWTAEPLWITATKQGKMSSVYGTPRCSISYDGYLPDKCPGDDIQFDPGFVRFRDNIEAAIDDLKGGFNLAAVQTVQVDIDAFLYGPDSAQVEQDIKTVADILDWAKDKLKTKGLQKKVNVAVSADHGKVAVSPTSHTFVRIEDHIVDLNDVRYILGRGGFCTIITMDGKTDDVYDGLQSMSGVTVYKRDDIPVAYHYKNNINTPDILVVADEGYFIEGLVGNPKQIPALPFYQQMNPGTMGFNGYLPGVVEEMNSAMFGWGPDFDVGPFDVVLQSLDPYVLTAHLADVEPLPNNGSFSDISVLLQPDPGFSGPYTCDDDAEPGATYTDCVVTGGGGRGGKRKEPICMECCASIRQNSTAPKKYNFAGAEFLGRWDLTITALSLGMNERLLIKRFNCGDEGCKWLELDNSISTPFTVHMHRSTFVMKLSDPDGYVEFKANCRGCYNAKKCPEVPDGQLGICIQKCNTDKDCGSNELCCSNGCGMECVHP